MLDKAGVLSQVRRVLAPRGIFVCLTPNGDYWWYRVLAPLLRLDTRHLSTDRFLTGAELREHVRAAGLAPQASEHWRFVPKGDVPIVMGAVLHGLDYAGRAAHAGALRGGLALSARRRDAPETTAPTAHVALCRRENRVRQGSPPCVKPQPQGGSDAVHRDAGGTGC
jgi:2-polyprenyl-6-hydroxyphenyl methylase/3-demethylubiquinone-9 3-methyltransferase